jgi:hypothetical protein
MTFDTTAVAHPVVTVLAGLDAGLDQAAEAEVWTMSDAQLLAAVQESERLAARLAGLQMRLVAETDARGLAGQQGAPSTAALLRHRLRLDPREATGRVRLATSGDLAATRQALAAGDLSAGHARVIAGVVRVLPHQVRAEAEAFLIDQAGVFDPARLGALGKHLRHVADPDGTDRADQDQATRRELSIVDLGEGGHALHGLLDAEGAALLRAALDPLAAPAPAADGTPTPGPAHGATATP